MNQMEIFKNPEFGSIRVIEEDGKYLFCGTDVATALGYAEGAKEDGDKDVIDILMEETAARTHLREEYFSDYRRYRLMQVDKTRVLLACRVIINDLLGKLYRYDYNVGYDCLLDDGNSVSRKLKKSNEEMEVEEDAIGDR